MSELPASATLLTRLCVLRFRYGSRCYRANPVHKREYSHSGTWCGRRWLAACCGFGSPSLCLLCGAASEDDDSDEDSDGVDARNIVQGRRKRQRVNYNEDSDDESEFDPDDE